MPASTILQSAQRPSRALHIALWVTQAIVAASFVGAGVMKSMMPIPQIAGIWPWTGELSSTVVRLLGLIDIASGLGVLLPALTRIKPGLTVLAAACCIVLQLCAMVFHGSRGELAALPVNVVFVACCAFVFWGRWKKAPIQATRRPSE